MIQKKLLLKKQLKIDNLFFIIIKLFLVKKKVLSKTIKNNRDEFLKKRKEMMNHSYEENKKYAYNINLDE